MLVAQRTEAMLRVAMLAVVAQKWRNLYGRLLMGSAWTGLSDILGMADAAGFGGGGLRLPLLPPLPGYCPRTVTKTTPRFAGRHKRGNQGEIPPQSSGCHPAATQS